MKNISRHAGKLEVLERMPSSRNGNPRYRLYIAGFHCVTAPDSSYGYSVKNFEGKQVVATIGTHFGRATLDSVELA